MRWGTIEIETPEGRIEALAPLIISASRSTDIPAFHAEWFLRRVRAGYVKWINPFNQKVQVISFAKARAIVFWTKNPEPLIPFLPELDEIDIPYYFQFTLNDYEDEHLEPRVPSLQRRIAVFEQLAKQVGRHRVLWRFDPLILAADLGPSDLLSKLRRVGNQLYQWTTKLIFSFADIGNYAKVSRNLRSAGIRYREFQSSEIAEIVDGIGQMCEEWGITAATCAEDVDLSSYGIRKNKCIDDELLLEISRNDPALVDLFGYSMSGQMDLFGCADNPQRKHIKDSGQRKECGCVFSKDIGQYNTCSHLCAYCYANTSPRAVQRNLQNSRADSESIVFRRLRGTDD